MSSVAHHLHASGWKYVAYFVLSPRHNRVLWGNTEANSVSHERTLLFDTEELMCGSVAQPEPRRTSVVGIGDVRMIAFRIGKKLDDFDAVQCAGVS